MPDGRKSVTASISTTYSFKNDIKLVLQVRLIFNIFSIDIKYLLLHDQSPGYK